MKNKQFSLAGLLFLGFALAMPAIAQADEVSDLNQKIDDLTKKIQMLEGKLEVVQTEVAKPAIAHPGHVVMTPESEGGLLHAAKDIQVGGHLDVQYNYNLTDSTDVIRGGNTGRIFDNDLKSFTINAAELNFTKEADPEGGAGFRIDIVSGEDTGVVAADGLTGDSFDLQQAYIEYVQPLKFFEGSSILPDSINIKAGRFVTLAGLEVIEGPDNWNISRSFAFGLTIPFVHTGVRTNFGLFNDKLDVYLGLNNGWDNPVDNNTYKTVEFGLGYSPLENVSLFHTIYYGPETTATNAHKRFLLTNVITWDATDKLSFMGEFNYGNQRREVTRALENIEWFSFNGYARYQLNDRWAVAYRAEFFRDTKAFRSGLDNSLWEQTLTLERKFTDSMLGRLEYRYDKANNFNAFDTDSHQSTIGAQLLYLI